MNWDKREGGGCIEVEARGRLREAEKLIGTAKGEARQRNRSGLRNAEGNERKKLMPTMAKENGRK